MTQEFHSKTAFLHGLNYGPGDCDELEKTLGEKLHIPNIPLYEGILPDGKKKLTPQELRDYERLLARKTAEELLAHDCRHIIAHSRGTLYGMLAAISMPEHQHLVESIVMIPAAEDPKLLKLAEGDGVRDFEDALLKPFCDGMDHQMYEDLKRRQTPTLKKAFKAVDPKIHAPTPEQSNAVVQQLDPWIRILIIDCIKDPFRNPERLATIIGSRKNVTISKPFDCGHFPHVQMPKELAEVIGDWRKNHVDA